MKKIIFTLMIAATMLGSCNQKADTSNKLSNANIEKMNDVQKLEYHFKSKEFQSWSDIVAYSENLANDRKIQTKASYVNVAMSDEARITLRRMELAAIDSTSSPENMRVKWFNILESSTLNPNSKEYGALATAIDVAIASIEYKMEIDAPEMATKGFWSSAWKAVQCVGGTIGSAGLGAIAGAGVGTVTLPVIGTVSGTALGGWSGALVGVATFC